MAKFFRRHTLFYNSFRKHSTQLNSSVPITFNMLNHRAEFQEVLPEVMSSLMSSPKIAKQVPEVKTWLNKLLDYNLTGGKQGRGLAVPFAYQMMEDPEHFTEEKLHTARFLGWCLEVLQAYILVVDDIIDVSTTRRGKPCWYLQPNVGSAAINDCVLLYQCAMEVIQINFGKEPFYTDFIELINEAVLYTSIGQNLDASLTYNKEKDNLDVFTMERFNAIAVNKTSYYSFRLPMLVALLIVKNGKERDTTELCNICFEFGKLLQFQNDYKDVYLDEAVTGKAGTDIQEGKLSWIAVTALERCNKSQRDIFKEYYGSKDPEHVKRIKQLYDELQVEKIYEKYEREVYDDLTRRIHALPRKEEARFLLEVLEAIRQRKY